MRIHEINEYHHIDLKKIVAIRQYIDKAKAETINGKPVYNYWIQVTIDGGKHHKIECANVDELQESYSMLLLAWQQYVGDNGVYEP